MGQNSGCHPSILRYDSAFSREFREVAVHPRFCLAGCRQPPLHVTTAVLIVVFGAHSGPNNIIFTEMLRV